MVEVGGEDDGGADPVDGKDAGEAMVEEGSGVGGATEFACGYGGDDDSADDEEEIDSDAAVLEDAEKICGGVLESRRRGGG